MKKFAKDIVDSFSVSQQEARFASLSYSSEAEVNFNFVRHSTAEKVKRAIDALPHKKSNTRVDKALELAASDIFSLQGGARTRRPMVLIVFFDGDVSRDMKDLAEVAGPLKDYGVKIVAVGVGPEVNTYQLAKVASSSNVIYKARTFGELLPELYSIAEETCSGKTGSPEHNFALLFQSFDPLPKIYFVSSIIFHFFYSQRNLASVLQILI